MDAKWGLQRHHGRIRVWKSTFILHSTLTCAVLFVARMGLSIITRAISVSGIVEAYDIKAVSGLRAHPGLDTKIRPKLELPKGSFQKSGAPKYAQIHIVGLASDSRSVARNSGKQPYGRIPFQGFVLHPNLNLYPRLHLYL